MAGREDVEEIQKWLNSVFGDRSEWVTLDEDGIAGWGTIRGLIRGLQLELGFTGGDVDGVFGNALKAKVPVLTPPTSVEQTIISIAQSAFRVKGYNAPSVGSGEFGHFTDQTVEALQQMCDDSNYYSNRASNGNLTINDEIWKGLCSQDAYVLLPGSDEKLRTIQRSLNATEFQPGIGLNPADGIVTPQMARALIKAVQIIVGVDPDGYWGDSTQAKIPPTMTSPGDASKWTKVLAYALYVNGYTGVNVSSPTWENVASYMFRFAATMRLEVPQEGTVDRYGITALFVSHGDQSRGWNNVRHEPGVPAIGIDTATRLTGLTKTFVTSGTGLNNLHVGFVGRYMQNAPDPVLDKEMTLEEIEELGQLKTTDEYGEVFFGIAPIWQTSANGPDYFIPGRGTSDAEAADTRAAALGIPNNVTIYFAVDFDAFGDTIDDLIVPYFEELNANLSARPIGVYGPRAVCNAIESKSLATASYVANLSYGWTGNLGQPMPTNWAIDQFAEFEANFYDDDGNLAGKYGVDQLVNNPENGQLWYPGG
jgi:peptidoglycan hydrolase-like protein with peptidoglycan-binding domain